MKAAVGLVRDVSLGLRSEACKKLSGSWEQMSGQKAAEEVEVEVKLPSLFRA